MTWDLPTRAFHWLLALSFTTAYLSARLGPAWSDWHLRAGYLCATLILFRIAWGFFGNPASRFGQFIKGPGTVLAYLRALRSSPPPVHRGHNPAGGWMILLMLATLAVLIVSGLFSDDLIAFNGPLAVCVDAGVTGSSSRVHVYASDLALLLVGLHLGAIAFYSLVLGQRQLLPAMLGRGRRAAVDTAGSSSLWLAFVILAIVASAVEFVASGAHCGHISNRIGAIGAQAG